MPHQEAILSDALLSPAEVILGLDATIANAMACMSKSGVDIVLVTDDRKHLRGVVVDSDIRRALLRNPNMDQSLQGVMNTTPLTLPADTSLEELRRLSRGIAHPYLPLTNSDGRVVHLLHIWALEHSKLLLPNAAVVMAGGRGSRLHPLTDHTPKPMVDVGGKPILETVIEQLATDGIKRIYLAVNYLSDQIETHFGDGDRFDVEITYLRETEPRGTVGTLSSLAGCETEPLLVMNGDILTRLPVRSLLDFHIQEGTAATLAVRSVSFDVPYGVVEIDDGRMVSIVEKPIKRYYVSAGVYALAPAALTAIPESGSYDMPDLLADMNEREPGSVACFPAPEYWRDIGQHSDLNEAQNDFGNHFGKS